MNQVERIAWYVRLTQDLLKSTCTHTLDMDALFLSTESLKRLLRALDIAFYPQLVGDLQADVVDPTRGRAFAAPTEWDERLRVKIDGILDGTTAVPAIEGPAAAPKAVPAGATADLAPMSSIQAALDPAMWDIRRCSIITAQSGATGPGVTISGSTDGHAHVVIGGSSWRTSGLGHGYGATPITEARVTCEATVSGAVWIFALMYRSDGALVRARRLTPLTTGVNTVGFRVRPNARKFDIALYFPSSDPPATALITEIVIEATCSGPNASPTVSG